MTTKRISRLHQLRRGIACQRQDRLDLTEATKRNLIETSLIADHRSARALCQIEYNARSCALQLVFETVHLGAEITVSMTCAPQSYESDSVTSGSVLREDSEQSISKQTIDIG